MDFTSSTTCLVGHEMTSAGFDSEDYVAGSEGGISNEIDWDSCSSHSSATSSSSASYSSHHSSSPHQHDHQHLHQQREHPPPQSVVRKEEEVMFYHSTKALWDSLAYITSMTDMCDVIFYVGKSRQPVYGVRSLLSVRSRVMYLQILHAQRTSNVPRKSGWKTLRHKKHSDIKPRTDGKIHIDITDYDASVFSHLISFLHSGRVTVDTSTGLGLYCAATEYEVQDLRTACWDFVERCAQRGTAHLLMTSGRFYLGRKALEKLSRKFLHAV